MQPDVAQRQTQQLVSYTSPFCRVENLSPPCLEQLSVFNARRANRFARSTTETAIDVTFERRRVGGESPLFDGAH